MRFLLDENVPNMYMNSILYIKRRINIRLQDASLRRSKLSKTARIHKNFSKILAIGKNMQYN